MNYLYLLIFILVACQTSINKDSNPTATSTLNPTNNTAIISEDTTNTLQNPEETNDFILNENRFNELELKFDKAYTLNSIEEKLPGCAIVKNLEFDPQIGSQNFVYSIRLKDVYIGELQMSEDDSLKLSKFYTNSLSVKDQYELKVGDSFDKLVSRRNASPIIEHNYYTASKAYFKNSNIQYEISGKTKQVNNPPSPPVPDDSLMKDWKIDALIFSKE